MKNKRLTPKPKAEPGADAVALGDAVVALIVGGPRGSLTTMAETLGMTPSALCKRLKRPGAGMDPVTIRSTLLIESRQAAKWADTPVESQEVVGAFVIETREGGIVTWRAR